MFAGLKLSAISSFILLSVKSAKRGVVGGGGGKPKCLFLSFLNPKSSTNTTIILLGNIY